MSRMTEAQARALAEAFVRDQPPHPDYVLEFDSIYRAEGRYYLRFTKLFHEPTKENPPYRLVVVDPSGEVSWGRP